jgi:hypothetical protein
MKKIIYLFAIMFVFTSCGDDPFSKVKSDNVKSAAVRDNTPFKYPVMTFDRKYMILERLMMGLLKKQFFLIPIQVMHP